MVSSVTLPISNAKPSANKMNHAKRLTIVLSDWYVPSMPQTLVISVPASRSFPQRPAAKCIRTDSAKAATWTNKPAASVSKRRHTCCNRKRHFLSLIDAMRVWRRDVCTGMETREAWVRLNVTVRVKALDIVHLISPRRDKRWTKCTPWSSRTRPVVTLWSAVRWLIDGWVCMRSLAAGRDWWRTLRWWTI